MTSHTRKWKEAQLKELRELASKFNVAAIADLKEFPAALSQSLRKKLKGKAEVRVSKTRLVQKVLSESKFKALTENAKGKSVAVIFSSINPFELHAFLKKNKGSIYAREGQIAENDITIPAGDTGLPPGPALSELKGAGLQVKVAGATIEIVKDKLVAKKGEPITAPVAAVLAKLDIKPMKVGLNLTAAQEHSDIYNASVLDVDTDKIFNDFVLAHQKAFNLAFNSFYVTEATVELLLGKAFREAREVSKLTEAKNEVKEEKDEKKDEAKEEASEEKKNKEK